MNTITYKVPNISCMHCAHTIKSELSEINGVSSVDVDIPVKEVMIQYSDPVTPEKLEKILSEINYPVQK